MSDITKPVSDDVATGMKRRTILAGAAWSVPVIAVATASPAFAATTTCPDLSQSSSWTQSNNGYVSGNGGYFTTEDGKNVFVQNGDNTSNSSQQAVGRVYLKASIPVKKGTTYTFTYDAFGNYGNYDKATSAAQYAHLSVGGGVISPDYTTRKEQYGNEQLNIQSEGGSRPWKQYSSTYTATDDGTAQVEWEFILPYKSGAQSSSDDIHMQLPIISCSS